MSASRAIPLLVGETEKADSSQGQFLVLGSVLKLWNVASLQMCKGTFGHIPANSLEHLFKMILIIPFDLR